MTNNLKQIEIIFEDDQLLLINKPPGLVVNRAENVQGATLQDWMETRLDQLFWQQWSGSSLPNDRLFVNRSGLVHRLDKDTSGIMILAKNPEAMVELMRQFKAREVKKKYLALAHGLLSPLNGFIRLPLARNPEQRQQFVVDPMGKIALTYYTVNKHLKTEKGWFSLISLSPKTGRTHQLRVHLKHLGHPLVSDQLYLGKKAWKADSLWCPRHFLHAQSLQFFHPRTKQPVSFSAPLPEDLAEALAHLED